MYARFGMADFSQLILSLTLIETKHQIELGLKEKASKKHRQYKVANMKAAVDEWADFSAQQLENRLDRIWKQKQKEVNCLDTYLIKYLMIYPLHRLKPNT